MTAVTPNPTPRAADPANSSAEFSLHATNGTFESTSSTNAA